MNIQQLSHEIGIGVDTLRVWERRYGCPAPGRDSRGHRIYSLEQIEELRQVKRLIDLGLRPGKIFGLCQEERGVLISRLAEGGHGGDQPLRELVERGTPSQMSAELADRRNELGLQEFVTKVALPLLQWLDQGWTMGQIKVAREHLVSDRLEELLMSELAGEEASEDRPQLLFLTLNGERHKLGLLLAAALFKNAGVAPIWLNGNLPLSEIPGLVAELQVGGVALSFSSHYSARQAREDIGLLRRSLPADIMMIAGGQSASGLPRLRNLLVATDLRQVPKLATQYLNFNLNMHGSTDSDVSH